MSRSEWIACGGETVADSPPLPLASSWSGAAERELSLDAAESQVRADLACLGWSARYRMLDATVPTATQCALWHHDGTEVPYGLGSGKGGAVQARVGAQFEALEHASSGPLAFDRLPVRLRSSTDLLDGPLGLDRAVRSIAEQRDATAVACLPYTALDGGPDLDIPLFLWATWFVSHSEQMTKRRTQLGDDTDYLPARSYSGSTGCAIGATYDEAVLHAVNEWAERDALSLFLLSSVYDGGPMCGRIDPDQLPEALSDHLDRASTLLGGPIVLLDLTTDLGIPVVAAYCPDRSGQLAAYGMGASLSGITAVERALTEIIQGELLARVVRDRDGVPNRGSGATATAATPTTEHPTFDELVAEHDIAAEVRRRLGGHPKLLACAQLDFAARIPEAPLTDLPREMVPPGTGVADQRSTAVARIAAAGHRVLAYELRALPHGTTVVQVQCLGLERFQMIIKGHLALPGPRGSLHRVRTEGTG